MTNSDFEIYLMKALDAPLGQAVVRWNAKNLWEKLSRQVYEKYGNRLTTPTHYCESDNPFTIHFTWDDKKGNVLECSTNEGTEIYVCFNKDMYYKDRSDILKLHIQDWKELLYLPELKMSDRLMEVFYLYFLRK